jgi:hypothetical protein
MLERSRSFDTRIPATGGNLSTGLGVGKGEWSSRKDLAMTLDSYCDAVAERLAPLPEPARVRRLRDHLRRFAATLAAKRRDLSDIQISQWTFAVAGGVAARLAGVEYDPVDRA